MRHAGCRDQAAAAFFEAQGHEGMRVLARLGRAAIEAGMLVIMDAKRNDIGSTNAAYADAWIGHDAPFPSDALTVNAFLGMDTLEPLLARADATGSGILVMTRTSNPGAGAIQDLDVDGKPLFHRLAEQLAPLAAARCDDQGGSSLGIVAGATWPDEARALRAILPSSPFLVPGRRAGRRPGRCACRITSNRHRVGRWTDQQHPRPDLPESRR